MRGLVQRRGVTLAGGVGLCSTVALPINRCVQRPCHDPTLYPRRRPADRKKLQWYLSKGLAEQTCDDPLTVRLTFQHKTGDQQQGTSGG